jgi:predicted peptidase
VRARAAAASTGVALLAVVAIGSVGRAARPRATAEAAPVSAAPVSAAPATRTAPGHFSRRRYADFGTVFQYQVFLPHDYDPARTWPVVVALHGSEEKGSDGIRQIRVGVGPIVQEQADSFPAVVIFPQVPSVGQGVRYAPAMARLIDAVVHEVNGDPDRVYLTGISFGGVLAWLIARERPDRFAAVVPISAPLVIQDGDRSTRLSQADADADEARALRSTPVWIFQGARDPVVHATDTRARVKTFEQAGVRVKYTEYPGPHEIWDTAYRTPELWRWLFAQHR